MRLAPKTRRARVLPLLAAAAWLCPAAAGAQMPGPDPRVGLSPGLRDAGQAIRGLTLVAHRDRPSNFEDPQNAGNFSFVNSDLAFMGYRVFQGNYNGFQVWDVSNPANPTLTTAFVCPGGQGDVSVYRNLLFVSVEERRARINCGTEPVTDTVSAERFRGVRIFDISDVQHPRSVGFVQTCRGSHTHTLVPDPKDPNDVYIYVSGTSPVRPGAELQGCSARKPDEDPNTAYFRIEVIKVPLAAPQDARIVNSPRIFATQGNIAGLWQGGAHGPGTQTTALTNQCHDITAYPELGLAAGACAGNGLLLDIRDPANPVRVNEVSDPNFAYWHSATFNNDGTKVLYSDEWGGGVQPRCRSTDPHLWGGDAVFSLASNHQMQLAGYYKLPAPQTDVENCVAHNGSLIPVPGRDIMVQAWYQGGLSVFDFTDPAHVQEIAFFDRGPVDASKLTLGGYWSAYWYNGHIYGSEIGRGLDVFTLAPSANLSQNEIDAANLVHVDRFNPQSQARIVWPARFVVARAYLDQLVRGNGISPTRSAAAARALDRAEHASASVRRSTLTTLAAQLDRDAARAADPTRVRALADVARRIARSGGR
jgi:hypothetical protein